MCVRERERERELGGYITPNKEDLVFKLNKTIYGFRQSCHEWYNIINDYLKSCGFKNNGLLQYLHKNSTRKRSCFNFICK